ncbi:hypothetical protein STXM2123_5649 [Streptomyces sp. F-3]|nr:hypothetical protein STXM2123_5649 [Streptomyces sp. F-3]
MRSSRHCARGSAGPHPVPRPDTTPGVMTRALPWALPA